MGFLGLFGNRQKQLEGGMASQLQNITQSTAPTRGSAELIASYKASPWLRAVVSKIGYSVGSTNWRLFATRRNGTAFRAIPAQFGTIGSRKKTVSRVKQVGVEVEEIFVHPLLEMLNNANPSMTGMSAQKLTQIYLDIKGEAFWMLERNARGVPAEYWPIPPNWVQQTPTGDNGAFMVRFVNQQIEVAATDMIWFRDLDPANPYNRGSGTGESLGDEIETDEYAAKMIKTFFYNRAKPDMLVSLEAASQEQAVEAKKKFEQIHRGYLKAHQAHFVGGKVNVHELSQKFTDMELSKLRQDERDMFISVYGVPPEMLGVLQNSNRSTISASRDIYAHEVLIPRLELLRAQLQMTLVPQYDERLILEYDDPSPDDMTFKLEAMRSATWGPTLREWRHVQGLEDRGEEDDIHMVPAAVFPVTDERLQEGAEAGPEATETEERALRLPKSVQKAPAAIEEPVEAIKAERLTSLLDPLFAAEVDQWGNAVLDDLGTDVAFNLRNPLVTEHLENFSAERLTGFVNETTKAAVASSLSKGIQAGEGIRELSARIRAVFAEADRVRAERIARTEVIRSSNFATEEAWTQSGMVPYKEWISTLDDKTRDTHAVLDGQIQPVGEDFEAFTGASAPHPGAFGLPEEDINCRCTMGAASTNEATRSAEVKEKEWKLFIRRTEDWEKETISDLRKAFKQQAKDAIKALEAVLG